jgi:hypothetical protein
MYAIVREPEFYGRSASFCVVDLVKKKSRPQRTALAQQPEKIAFDQRGGR